MSLSVKNCTVGSLDVADLSVVGLHESFSSHRKSVLQGTSAAVHAFCERQKPIPDGAGQYYVAGADHKCV